MGAAASLPLMACAVRTNDPHQNVIPMTTGLDRPKELIPALRGKRIAILTHAAGVDRFEKRSIDVLAATPGVKLTAITKNTITSRTALNTELARIRKQGYALDNEEREEGLHCIGAPIFDHTGLVVATLSVSWPGFRYGRGDEAEKIEKVKAAAGRISTILGYEP